jgi:hypothetical protein
MVIVAVVAILRLSGIDGSNMLLKMLPILSKSLSHALNYKQVIDGRRHFIALLQTYS